MFSIIYKNVKAYCKVKQNEKPELNKKVVRGFPKHEETPYALVLKALDYFIKELKLFCERGEAYPC